MLMLMLMLLVWMGRQTVFGPGAAEAIHLGSPHLVLHAHTRRRQRLLLPAFGTLVFPGIAKFE